MTTLTPEQRTVLSRIQASPVWFVRHVLGGKPYDKQAEMLNAVRDHRNVSVVGCNGSGKDWTAARVVLWWLSCYAKAKAIVTGPTGRQVEEIVWNELRSAHANAPYEGGIGGRMYPGTAEWSFDSDRFALGFSTDNPYNIQGFHSPHLLVVVTEAHGVKEADFVALRRLNPERFLMTGNPFVAGGEFYDSHHSKRAMYKTISISAFDTPNVIEGREIIPGAVTVQDIEDRKAEWGEDSPYYIGGILGKFPDNLDNVMVPLSIAQEAAKRKGKAEGTRILGLDVARSGADKSVGVLRQGNHSEIVLRVQGNDLMTLTGRVVNVAKEQEADVIVVDSVGIGSGVYDRLRELRLPNVRLVEFMGGSSPRDRDRFVNAIAECWWAMRTAIIQGDQGIPNDDALIGQLASREWRPQSDRKIRLQPKEEMAKSPDEADALAMTFAHVGGFKAWV